MPNIMLHPMTENWCPDFLPTLVKKDITSNKNTKETQPNGIFNVNLFYDVHHISFYIWLVDKLYLKEKNPGSNKIWWMY